MFPFPNRDPVLSLFNGMMSGLIIIVGISFGGPVVKCAYHKVMSEFYDHKAKNIEVFRGEKLDQYLDDIIHKRDSELIKKANQRSEYFNLASKHEEELFYAKNLLTKNNPILKVLEEIVN